jgi:hypothetical protein
VRRDWGFDLKINEKRNMVEIVEILLLTKWGVVLLRTVLRFLKRKTLKTLETSNDILSLENPRVDIWAESNTLPMIAFKIPIRTRTYLKLELKRLYVKIICDNIPFNTIFWYKDCNIDDVEAPDIEPLQDGSIKIICPCRHIYPMHIHKWEMVGEVVFDSEIGDFRREIRLVTSLNVNDEKKLQRYLLEFRKEMLGDVP